MGVKIWRTRALYRRKWACFVGEAKGQTWRAVVLKKNKCIWMDVSTVVSCLTHHTLSSSLRKPFTNQQYMPKLVLQMKMGLVQTWNERSPHNNKMEIIHFTCNLRQQLYGQHMRLILVSNLPNHPIGERLRTQPLSCSQLLVLFYQLQLPVNTRENVFMFLFTILKSWALQVLILNVAFSDTKVAICRLNICKAVSKIFRAVTTYRNVSGY